MSASEPTTPLSPDGPSRQMRHILLAGILLAAAFLRLYRLDDLPPPMNADEASRGYDAWSLWQTGRDQFGEFMPLLLRSFGPGDYPAAASAYIAAPFTGLLGPGALGIRLATALAGIATVGIVYLWLYRERGAKMALFAAGLLALNPWHVRMTRWAPEADIAPFFLAAGLCLFTRAGFLRAINQNTPADENADFRPARSRRESLWAVAAGITLGIGAWVYHAPRLVIPLLLICVFLFAVPLHAWLDIRNRSARRRMAGLLVGLFIGTTPITYSLWKHPERLMGRVEYTSVFSKKTLRKPGEPASQPYDFSLRLGTAARQYAWYFDPVMLAWNADVEPGSAHPGHSWLTFGEVALFFAGIFHLLSTCRRNRFHRLLLIWLLVFPVPAALAVGPAANPLRAICGLPILPLVEAVGAGWLCSIAWGRTGVAVLFVAILIHVGFTAHFYVTDLPKTLSHQNAEELFDAFEWAAQADPPWDAIYVSPRFNQPQVLMLVATRFDPHRLQKSQRVDVPWSSGYYQTLQIDKWHFLPKRGPDPWQLDDLPGLLAAHPPGSRILILCRPYSPSRGQFECPWGEVLRTFSARDDRVWLEARQVVVAGGEVRENRPVSQEYPPSTPR